MYKKCYIIAGHGNGDCGAVNGEYKERDFIEKIVEDINSLKNPFFKIVNLRPEMSYNAITEYINEDCKKNKLDSTDSLLVSVHCDWRGATSGEMAYYYRGSETSQKFAQTVIKNMPLKDKYTLPDTSCRFGQIGHIYYTIPLAILVECGSIGKDLEHLKNNSLQIAQGIVNGVLEFSGIDLPKNDKTAIIAKNSQAWQCAESLREVVPMKIDQARLDVIQSALHESNEYLRNA